MKYKAEFNMNHIHALLKPKAAERLYQALQNPQLPDLIREHGVVDLLDGAVRVFSVDMEPAKTKPLWAVHVLAFDSVLPAASHGEATLVADIITKEASRYDVGGAVVVRWEGTAEQHAAARAKLDWSEIG